MSGGRSSSRSSSTNTTATDNSNTQINDTEGLVLNFEGSENNEATIIQSDQGAIQESFSFAESALGSVGNIATEAFLTTDNTVNQAFSFGLDALDDAQLTTDKALTFGETVFREGQTFGRDVLSEAQDITTTALSIAGNAQTNAFAKIRDIAASFSSDAFANRNLLLIALGAGAFLLIAIFLLRRRK